MTTPFATLLPHRGVIRVGGVDYKSFLQNLVSNDVTKATAQNAAYAALLTPQGKFLHDFFILGQEDAFLLDCEAARADDLIHRLSTYKLRAKVTFENFCDRFDVWAVWNGSCTLPFSFTDTRLPPLGSRAFIEKGKQVTDVQLTDLAAYDKERMTLGVADGSRDLEIEKSTLADGNIDILNGVDWKKGCYIGQELTARMHYRGLAKKRLFPVRLENTLPSNALFTFEGAEVGILRSQSGAHGLALLNKEAVQKSLAANKPLTHANSAVTPFIPSWLQAEIKPDPLG